jgi:oligopeptide transport system permease protein
MATFVVRRILAGLAALFCIVTLTFFLLRLMPGGPFDRERELPPSVRENIERKWRLDRPLVMQYLHYLGGLMRLDMGESMARPGQTVRELLMHSAPKSLAVGGAALAFAVGFGLVAGILAAMHQNRPTDYALMSASMLGFSVPNMVLGPLLALVIGLWLRWLPTSGWGTWRHLVLPAAALGVAFAGRIARIMRASMLEVIRQDYIRTARAKGLPERVVILRHALREAVAPIVSYLGPAAAAILTGSVIIEEIFHVPGMGRYFVSAPADRDYTLVLGTVLVYSTLLIVFNTLVDIVQAVLNPRIRLG